MISFDRQMRTIHDHLYANANIRLPEELQLEVAKVIQTLSWVAAVEGAPPLSIEERKKLTEGDVEAIRTIARDIRGMFRAYNQQMRRYPRNEAVIKLDDNSVAYIINQLSEVDMSDMSRDWLGDALEVFRSTAAKRLGGQFFTDQRVTKLAIGLLEFNPEEDDLVDICAGTGGFLIAGVRAAQHSGFMGEVQLIGIEVDPSLAHLANSTLKHLTLGNQEPVFNADSFRRAAQWPLALRKTVIEDSHRCLASNPPFGQKITIKDPDLLSRYELGHVWSKTTGTWTRSRKTSPTPPDILFLERNVKLAIPGQGRVGIVLPYQILSGPQLGYVREWLLRNTSIKAVVDLPEDTFQPWTGTKTALVIVERREQPLEIWEPEDYDVFMAVSEHIGHDRRGNPIVDSNGLVISDLEAIYEDFVAYTAGKPMPNGIGFSVSALDFSAENDLRINASYYHPDSTSIRSGINATDPSSYRNVRLEDAVEKIFFPGRFKRSYVADPSLGIRFLGGTNITQLLPTNPKYLAKSFKRLDEFLVKPGWLLVTRSGTTGVVSSVPAAWDGWAISEHVIRIVPKEDGLPGEYIEAFLRSDAGQQLLSQGIFGSVINEISPEFIGSLSIPVPNDENELECIVEEVKKANRARQDAIASFASAENLFQKLVGGKISRIGDNADLALPDENVGDECQELVESKIIL